MLTPNDDHYAKLASFSGLKVRRTSVSVLVASSWNKSYHLIESELTFWRTERQKVKNMYTAGSFTITSDLTIGWLHAPATKPHR